MSKKNATSYGLIKKAETLLYVLAYIAGGDHEDLLQKHDEALWYVRIKPPSEYDVDEEQFDGEPFERQVLCAVKKLYRRAFKRLKQELGPKRNVKLLPKLRIDNIAPPKKLRWPGDLK